MPQPTELAVLTVDGKRYDDWESVLVRQAYKEQPPYRYRFTCSEGVPADKNFAVMRIRPGMTCSVTLAGFPAITGYVHTRQVFADAQRHYVEIQGATRSMDASVGAAVTPTGEFTDKTFQQIAESLLKDMGLKLVVEGGALPNTIFHRVSIQHGQTVVDVLDPLARALEFQNKISISFTSNPFGDFVAAIGPSSGSDSVIEGKNMLEAREIIFNPAFWSGLPPIDATGRKPTVVGQAPGNNEEWGTKPAIRHTTETMAMTRTGARYLPQVIVNEIPAWTDKILQGRAGFDSQLQAEDQVTIIATVYGWLRPSGGLWKPGQRVTVISPMLIMDGSTPLFLYAVNFTQDNHSGTRSQLELRNAAAMGGLMPQIN